MLVLPIPVLFSVPVTRLREVLVLFVGFIGVLAIRAIFILIPLVPIAVLAVVIWLVLTGMLLPALLGAVLRLLSGPALFARLPPLFARLASVRVLPTAGALLTFILPALSKKRAR